MTNTPVSPNGRSQKSPAKSIRAGSQLQGRYNLINRIAVGGMGEVWRARDTRTGTMVAAKVLRPELTGEEISLSRLRIEAKNAMKARHPNIAAVLDSGESQGQGWIVMELVTGEPLTNFVGDGKRLSAKELIPILSQTAFALDGAAQAGIVHRDIKPANIMIRDDGLVKLTDFGISYTAGQANLTAVGMVMGTAQYLAPEQAMGSVATHSGDLYALGIIAYEALAGYRPFTGQSVVEIAMAHVNEDVPPLPADVPQPLADLVYQLLAKEPQMRPTSGTALVRSLRGVANEIGVTTDPVPLTKPSPAKTQTPTATPRSTARNLPTRSRQQPPKPTRNQGGHEGGSPTQQPPKPTRNQGGHEGGSPTQQPQKPTRNQGGHEGGSPTAQPPSPQKTKWHPVDEQAVAPRRATPSPPPPRARANRSKTKIDVGLWVIIALVVLTLVLIVVAMLRDKTVVASDQASGHEPSAYSAELEVELWLKPIRVS